MKSQLIDVPTPAAVRLLDALEQLDDALASCFDRAVAAAGQAHDWLAALNAAKKVGEALDQLAAALPPAKE